MDILKRYPNPLRTQVSRGWGFEPTLCSVLIRNTRVWIRGALNRLAMTLPLYIYSFFPKCCHCIIALVERLHNKPSSVLVQYLKSAGQGHGGYTCFIFMAFTSFWCFLILSFRPPKKQGKNSPFPLVPSLFGAASFFLILTFFYFRFCNTFNT